MVGWFSLFRTSQFVTKLLFMMMLIVPFEYWHALYASASHNIASTTGNNVESNLMACNDLHTNLEINIH